LTSNRLKLKKRNLQTKMMLSLMKSI